MRRSKPTDRVEGAVTDVRILGRDSWGKLTLDTGSGELVPVVGTMVGLGPGDSIVAEGFWSNHERFGKQFKAQTIQATRPRTESGAIAWMRSRLPSIGPKRAAEMIRHFGSLEAFWQIVETAPERLAEVPGITAARAQAIANAYDEHRATRDRDVRLRSLGLTANQVGKLVAAWGEDVDVEARLRADPYQVVGTIKGFGWQRADAIARSIGFPPTAPSRIVAALHHAMSEAASSGHTYLPIAKLIAYTAAKVLRDVGPDEVRAQLPAAALAGALTLHPDDSMATAPHLELAERAIASAVRTLKGPTDAA